jgi:hypothetical protein
VPTPCSRSGYDGLSSEPLKDGDRSAQAPVVLLAPPPPGRSHLPGPPGPRLGVRTSPRPCTARRGHLDDVVRSHDGGPRGPSRAGQDRHRPVVLQTEGADQLVAFASRWLAGEHLDRAVRRLGRAREGPLGLWPERANCQLFAYGVLGLFGLACPPLPSSELWEDTEAAIVAELPEPLDLVLFNSTEEPRGAHLGVWMAPDEVFHLGKTRSSIWVKRSVPRSSGRWSSSLDAPATRRPSASNGSSGLLDLRDNPGERQRKSERHWRASWQEVDGRRGANRPSRTGDVAGNQGHRAPLGGWRVTSSSSTAQSYRRHTGGSLPFSVPSGLPVPGARVDNGGLAVGRRANGPMMAR